MNSPSPRCKRVKLGDTPTRLLNQDATPAPDRAMRKIFFLEGRRASAKAATQLLGVSRYQREIAAARVAHYTDPSAVYAVDTPGGRLTIIFRTI